MPRLKSRSTRTLLGALTLAGATLGAAAGHATGAGAYPPYEPGNPGNTSASLPSTTTTTTPPPCKNADGTWATMPRVVLHTGEYVGEASTDDMATAVGDIDARIAAMGATSAKVTSLVRTTNAFHFQVAYGDTRPTIHVGFVDDLPEKEDQDGTTLASTKRAITDGPCETHIAVVETGHSWNYGTPLSTGAVDPAHPDQVMYYEAGRDDAQGKDWFRDAYLHELLHAFNLDHTHEGYAFMNYGERPWARGASDKAARPLPDDVEHIRALYPAAGTFDDVSVLNTYYDPDQTSGTGPNAPAKQFMLCAPSKGGSFAADKFGATCGSDSSQSVCTGDTLRSRVAFANTSTEAVDVTVRYWLSSDDVWDPTDLLSDTQPASRHFSHTSSGLISDPWTVPDVGTLLKAAAPSGSSQPVGDRTYHVIARVEATTASGATMHDWIPLRGTITVPKTCI
jgi:hypothetical protein